MNEAQFRNIKPMYGYHLNISPFINIRTKDYQQYKTSEKSIFVDMIKRKVFLFNENALIGIIGQTGSGKSYASLRLAYEIEGDKFDVNNQVVFSAKEFMELVQSGVLEKGSVIIYDEGGVGQDARSFMSIINKAFNYVMQTIRFKNYIIIFTTPNLRFLDYQIRSLFHFIIWMDSSGKNMSQKMSSGKMYYMDADWYEGKNYRWYPRISSGDKIRKLKIVKFKLPPANIVRIYEQKKKAFTDELYKDITSQLADWRVRWKDKTQLSPEEQSVYDMLRTPLEDGRYRTRKEVATYFGYSTQKINKMIADFNQRGFDVPDITPNGKLKRHYIRDVDKLLSENVVGYT